MTMTHWHIDMGLWIYTEYTYVEWNEIRVLSKMHFAIDENRCVFSKIIEISIVFNEITVENAFSGDHRICVCVSCPHTLELAGHLVELRKKRRSAATHNFHTHTAHVCKQADKPKHMQVSLLTDCKGSHRTLKCLSTARDRKTADTAMLYGLIEHSCISSLSDSGCT